MTDLTLIKYRNAILWAIDYFGADGLTEKERASGITELGNVILGRASRAVAYVPNERDTSAKISKPAPRDESDWDHRGDSTPLNYFAPRR